MSDVAHAPARAIPRARETASAVALFAAAWLYVFPHYPALNNPNENVRVYMTAALVEAHQYEIRPLRERWGWTNDAACVDEDADGALAPCDGPLRRDHARRYYSVKAPLASWLAVPGYAIASALHRAASDEPMGRDDGLWWMRLFASGLPMLAFFAFFHRWLGARVRSPIVRDATYVATALGSVLLGYSYLLASHATSAAAAFASFALLRDAHRDRRRSSARVVLAGLLATAATALEYPCFFVTLALCLYALVALREGPGRTGKHLALFGLGALGPVLLVMHFQASAFGSPSSPGHLFVENPAFRAGHESGFFGADRFRWDAAWKLLVHPRLGLLATTPLFSFAALGAVVGWSRDRVATLVAGLACLVTYAVICTMNNWDGGWVVGPRYLVVTLPFVAVAAAMGLDAIALRRARLGHALALGSAAASIVTGGVPSLYPHLPPDLNWPLAHLFPALYADGRTPPNLLFDLGVRSPHLALLPLALLAIVALVFAAHRSRDRLLGALAFAIAVALVAPQILLAPKETPEVERAVTFVESTFLGPSDE